MCPQGVGVQEVLRALADAARAGDKSGRQQLVGLLLRLFFFEELPPEAIHQLMPLFQVGAGTASRCLPLWGRPPLARASLAATARWSANNSMQQLPSLST